MFIRAISTIGTVAIILILTSSVDAKPISRSSEQTSKGSQSSKSLQGIDSRNIADFSGLYQTPSTSDVKNSRNQFGQNLKQNRSSKNILGDNISIDSGDSLIDGTPEPLRINLDDNEYNSRFSVKYKLNR